MTAWAGSLVAPGMPQAAPDGGPGPGPSRAFPARAVAQGLHGLPGHGAFTRYDVDDTDQRIQAFVLCGSFQEWRLPLADRDRDRDRGGRRLA